MDAPVAPDPRPPMPARSLPAIRGERVVIYEAATAQHLHGWRAWSDLRDDGHGGFVVDVVSERDWWMHDLLGAHPSAVLAWPSLAVWVA